MHQWDQANLSGWRNPVWATLTALVLGAHFVSAQDSRHIYRPQRANIEFTLIDWPYNTPANAGGIPRFPSMTQSLTMSKSFYEGSHAPIALRLDPYAPSWQGFFNRLAYVGYDLLTMTLPPGSAWLHEEWHRAVMGNRNIDSHNGVYDFKGGSVIPVDQVKDEDLARLKSESNPDFVRLSIAGMEGEHRLSLEIEKDHFFHGTRTFDYPTLAMLKISPALYLDVCASRASDESTDEQNLRDGANVDKRDFTGLDCNAWIYDLRRPEESYTARGTHPSGVGVNRYRRYSDLEEGEQRYLRLQASLSWLNFVDPFVFGYESFGETPWNITLGHDLTPFGYVIDLNFFHAHGDGSRALATLHAYRNGERAFPGVDVEVRPAWRHPWMAYAGLLSYRVGLWQQPDGLQFSTTDGTAGGLLGARALLTAIGRANLYGEVLHKTRGWVPGVVSLDRSTIAQIGISTLVL